MQYVKTLGAVAVLGTVGALLFKVLMMAMAPVFAMLTGVLVKALMIGLVAGLAFFLYRMFRRRQDEMAA